MNTKLNKTTNTSTALRASIVAITLIGSLVTTNSVTAASACKGLENSACNANASCGWVNAYERKDGRSVKAFCRTSSAKKTAKKNSDTKRSIAKKASTS